MLTPSLLIVLLCAFTALILSSVRRIPEGHAYTLRRVGGHMRTLGAGFHLVLPLIERVAHKINLLGNVVDVTVPAEGAVDPMRGRIYFQVMDAQRADAVIDDVAELLRRRIPELVAANDDNDLAACGRQLKAALNRDLCDRGLLITRVQLSSG